MDKRGKRLRGRLVTMLIIIATIVTAMPSLMGYANTTRMNLKGSYSNKEEAIYLDWETPNQSEPYTYQMFSKKPDTDEFQSISASNLDLDKVVRALNVFPVNHVSTAGSNYIPKKDTNETDLAGKPLYRSAMLKEWIGEFGHGKIEVDAINQNDFDADPEKYLKDENGNYKYDVVAVGFWNINQGQNHFLGDNGMKHLREFVESGRGVLTGHHHIALRELDKGMNKLKDLFGIKFLGETGWNQYRDTYYDKPVTMDYTSPHKSVSPHNSRFWATGDEVVASKRGLLLEYPNYVAQEGRVFDIPLTHNGGDYVTGDVWLEFTNPMSYRTGVPLENPEQLPDGTKGSTNAYLSTYNNTALIQTGHSSLTGGHLYSTEDEKMLVANTIFYLAQLTQDTNLVDRSAMDIYPPYFVNDEVDVIRTDNNIRVSYPDSIDPTKEFEYYVKATGQDTGNELDSETIKVKQTSGVVGYSYVMDNKPDTVPDNKVDTTSRTINIPNDRNQGEYLHISAVDAVGNVSEPLHIDLRESYYKVEGNVFDDVNFNGVKDVGEGNIPHLTVTLEDDKGNPLTDLNGNIYKTKTDKNGNYSFGMYTGGNMRVKFDSVTDKLFTVKIDGSGGDAIQNHVVGKLDGATDVFSLNQNQPNIKRNAGLTQRESYFRNLHLGVKGYYDKEVDGIHVDWNVPDDEEPYIYQVYSKKPEHTEFQTVSTTDLDLEVRVLNVHPDKGEMINYTTWDGTKRTESKSASLERWMEEPNSEHSKGYGMGVIDVTPVTMSEFNENPDKYLKDKQGEYKYDVMFVGTWDANGRIGFDKNATDKVEEFIDSGRGILAGHDTLGYIESSQYFRTLADKFNIDPLSGSTKYIGHTEVVIDKRGLLTNYPWNIGEVGTKLTVPHTHTLRQIVNGDVWLRFTGSSGVHAGAPQWLLDDPLQNSYLTTWNNTAMIQTGHSDAEATPDEQKILANTLFLSIAKNIRNGDYG